MRLAATVVAALLLAPASAAAAERRVLDDFSAPGLWRAAPAAGVALALAADQGEAGAALRLDFDFQGHGGYAVAHRELPLDLPANWELTFRLRGAAPPENLEVKLIDASGDNVWWVNRRDFVFSPEWTTVRIKKRQLTFAWGPRGGGELLHAAALEIAITAGSGGKGAVWIADLALTELPPPHPYDLRPVATASSARPGGAAELAVDGDPATAWRPAADGEATLTVDFGEPRELGGLTVRWSAGEGGHRFAVDLSADGGQWQTVRTVERGRRPRNDLLLPETETRWLRLRWFEPRSAAAGLAELEVRPLEFGASPNAFFAALAAEAPRGTYPRSFSGEQSYWTVVGPATGGDLALLGEDGALEPGAGLFSVEPFLWLDGRRVGWSEVTATQTLADGYLPVPTVAWSYTDLRLEITALADGGAGETPLAVRYRLHNLGPARRQGRLWLAVRPFQVNPPAQFLGRPGGVAALRHLACEARGVRVGADRLLLALPPAADCGVAAFDEGPITGFLANGELPPATEIIDDFGYSSGALAWSFDLEADATRDLWLALPPPTRDPPPAPSAAHLEERLAATAAAWHQELDRVELAGPPAAQPLFATLKSSLAYVLTLRQGAALHPGARSYARSWIRDGALMAEALLRLGHPAEARAFAEWYVGFQDPDGRVPCCVDARGADPVPEHDSAGELIHLVAEVVRYGGDRELARRLYPHVQGAVAALDALRQQCRTPVFAKPGKLRFFGLLPESISHEGYSAKPMHSYWDDFWGLIGLADAVDLATQLGETAEATRWTALRTEMAAEVGASVRRVMAEHHIRYVPGCAELGDFDPTSTAIALAPGGLGATLPEVALRRTFERYWDGFVRRRDGTSPWEVYTPYELRGVGAFVRLGWRQRAGEALAWFLGDRRPSGWNQWPEVVGREARTPRFLGDLPHGWVAAELIRAGLDLFAWERRNDDALVLAAGLPAEWLTSRDGVLVRGLPTPWGRLDYRLTASGDAARWHLGGDLQPPPGGLVLTWPLAGRPTRATVGGQPVALSPAGEVVVRTLPAEVVVSR